MGAQENKQVVRDLYAAFGRGDITALLALVAEDMVWRMLGVVPHFSGTYRGPSGVAGFFRELNANVRIESFEPREFVAEADCVLVTGWSRGRVKSTGRMVDNRWVMAFNVHDGKITKFEEFADTQALATAHENEDQVEK